MWSEARKQERRIRGMMVDYKKRAERRREYYDRIKTDPAQFLQIHGRAMKIHLDPSIAQQAEAPSTMMPWQGQDDTIIDRFDVRAHLDYIKEQDGYPQIEEENESKLNYERYRILVQNDFAAVKENKFLHQIYIEERFGGSVQKKQEQEAEKKKIAEKKAAIGYCYDDGEASQLNEQQAKIEAVDDADDSEEEIDLDIAFDVDEISVEQAREMNTMSATYGMIGTEFIDQLVQDKADLEALREARAVEEERAAGRRNRRDRRRAREQARSRDLNTIRTGDFGMAMGLPAYAAAPDTTEAKNDFLREKSSSRSPSPQHKEKVCFITSFGGDSGDESRKSPIKTVQHKSRRRSSRSSRSSSSDDSVSSRERRRRRARKNGDRKPSSSSSSSRSRRRSTSKIRSTSPRNVAKLPTPPRKSYYRHDLKSDDESDEASADDHSASQLSDKRATNDSNDKRSTASKSVPLGKLTPQERLRRKMQAMLRKTHQSDQLARMEKEEKAREERQQREELLKEHLAKYQPDGRYDSDSDSEKYRRRSYSQERSRSRERRKRRSLSRTRSSRRRSKSRSRERSERSKRSRSRSRRRRSSSRDRRTERTSDYRGRRGNRRDRSRDRSRRRRQRTH